MNRFINKSIEEFLELGNSKKEEYLGGHPYPHIVLDNFFNDKALKDVVNEFPSLEKMNAIKFANKNENKLASKGEFHFGDNTKDLMHFLNSQPFLLFLSAMTGIPNLIPDPYFEGGGYHQILPGGFLKIHADFNKHYDTKLDRRLNVLVYLNENWEESYGGHFELWDREMKGCEKKILPLFNRMAVFTTTDFSFHGHPDPLTCPTDRSRKSLALYYYTNGRPSEEVNHGLEEHSTIFKARPGIGETLDPNYKPVVQKPRNPITAKKIIKGVTPPFIYELLKSVLK